MAGGYQQSTEAMRTASDGVTTAAEDMTDELKELAPTAIVNTEFGQAHQQHYDKYKGGVDVFGEAVAGFAGELNSFAGQISGAGGTYDSGEQGNTSTVSNAGGN